MKKAIILISITCLIIMFSACSNPEEEIAPTNEPSLITAPAPTNKPTQAPPPTTVPENPDGVVTNVALDKTVIENGHSYVSGWWNKDFLTDGIKMIDDIDGSTNGWMSDASPKKDDETWVYVDLENTYIVEAVAVYPRESKTFFPVVYQIQVSIDEENWTTVKSVENDDGSLEANRYFEIEPTEARYVCVLVTERYAMVPAGTSGYIAELSEIEVYA